MKNLAKPPVPMTPAGSEEDLRQTLESASVRIRLFWQNLPHKQQQRMTAVAQQSIDSLNAQIARLDGKPIPAVRLNPHDPDGSRYL